MLSEILIFIPLAILSNTVVPVPFEPILLAFLMFQNGRYALILVLVGTICAAVGSWIDVRLSRSWNEKAHSSSKTQLMGFYLGSCLCAFLPIPFSFVRIALFKIKPPAFPYVLSVICGRLPRYWMIAHFTVSLLN